ncbi:MAG TPA: BolA family protein [Sphingomonadales bacterium]
MTVAERMKDKIEQAFQPVKLDIVNESHKHKGHGGYHPSGESHFHITIVSDFFKGKSRVERQRAVYALLDAELKETVHALSLVTRTPEEAGL